MHFWKVIFQGEDITQTDDITIDFRDLLYRHENIEELQFPIEAFQQMRTMAKKEKHITFANNIKRVWSPTGVEANKHNCVVLCVKKPEMDEYEGYLFMLIKNKLTLAAAAPTLHAEMMYRKKEWKDIINEIFASPEKFDVIEVITPWTDYWEVVLEGEDIGTDDDQIIPFYSLNTEDFPSLRFNFFYKLIKNALAKSNVVLIENIKKIRDPNGKEIDLDNDYFIILEGTLKEENIQVAYLFRLNESQELEVIGAHPEEVAEFCYEEEEFFINTLMYFVEKPSEWTTQRIIINIETKKGDFNVED